MALPPSDPKRHRRQQLRRALIGWIGGAALFALFVLAAILGGDKKEEPQPIPAHSAGLFDYHMTSDQFDRLHPGETQRAVLAKLGKVGLPESETKIIFIQLFPPHDESIVCSYWEISNAEATIARLCFSSPDGVLRQKLERDLAAALEGESSVQA